MRSFPASTAARSLILARLYVRPILNLGHAHGRPSPPSTSTAIRPALGPIIVTSRLHHHHHRHRSSPPPERSRISGCVHDSQLPNDPPAVHRILPPIAERRPPPPQSTISKPNPPQLPFHISNNDGRIMTSISPARARLQSPSMGGASGSGQPRASERSDGRKDADGDEVEFLDSRPAKRRKLSTHEVVSFAVPESARTRMVGNERPPLASQSARYIPVSWRTAVSSASSPNATQGTAAQIPSLPERPWSLQRTSDGLRHHGPLGSRVRQNKMVPTTPDSMSTPSSAPRLEDGRRADYFPWVGKHPEDNLTETTVKMGYFDRAPNPLEKESNTAKAALSNAFRHRAGLESLSALFSLVLSHKSNRGAFSSTSTFKGPPPRVTLTEVKRKSWISDLGNLTVPLKRLSKTIPQGIRGLPLLEQCLFHRVPLSRALWFAKCVGANEIRTLKRKGINPMLAQGAEAKWLREWTVNVEQFLEQILLQCGQSGWKELSSYALRLATRLYAENLLDRDHYLEWMTKCLSASKLEVLPFWVMMVDMHTMDLVAYRKRGKQYAESMVGKLNTIHHHEHPDLVQPLATTLARAIKTAVDRKPVCFLMPDKWEDCKRALEVSLDAHKSADRDRLDHLQQVNERALGVQHQGATIFQSNGDNIVHALDSVHSPIDVASLSKHLQNLCSDTALLITTCLQWSVSRYRSGLARVYLIVRLCRRWHRADIDIDPVFQHLLQYHVDSSSTDLAALQHLTCELSRSQTLSVSKYIQWLTVRGLPRPRTFADADVLVYTEPDGTEVYMQSRDGHRQLLTECCVVGRSDHIRNLRDAVLGKGGYDSERQRQVVEACKAYIHRMISDPHRLPQERARPRFALLPWSMRSELAYYIRHLIGNRSSINHSSTPLTFAQFCVGRDVLEELEDLALLADVLRIGAFSKDEDILSTVANTITFYAKTFSAMGALHPLQSLVCRAYVTLRPVKTFMPTLLTSLIQLCEQYPIKITPLRALQQDLVKGDRSRAVAACSPFSDGVAESLQQAGETFYDDFEAILQTESNMNEVTLSQLFEVLTERIAKLHQGHPDHGDVLQLCQLLCRLKLSHPVQGNLLLTRWVRTELLKEAKQPLAEVLLLNLIGTQCIGLDVILDVCQSLPPQAASKQLVRKWVTDVVANRIPDRISRATWYAVRPAVQSTIDLQPDSMLELLAVGEGVPEEIISSLINRVVLDADSVNALPKVASMVPPDELDKHHSSSLEAQVTKLMKTAGPLAILHVQHRLRALSQEAMLTADEAGQDTIATTICTCFRDDVQPLCQSPRSIRLILGALNPVIRNKIRTRVENDFYDALPKFLQGRTTSYFPLPSVEDGQHAANALRLVYMVNTDQGPPQPGPGVGVLVEKLSTYLKCLTPSSLPLHYTTATASGPGASPAPSTPAAPQSSDSIRVFLMATTNTLNLLLSMVCLKRSVLAPSQSQPSPAAAKQNQQDQIKLVGLIISIATHSAWTLIAPGIPTYGDQQTSTDVISFMFDVAATLIDDMAEETRLFCARLLKEKMKDPRVKWLLGSVKMFGSLQFKDITAGLEVHNDSKGLVSEFKPKVWEMLENGGTSNDACLGLGLFGAKHL